MKTSHGARWPPEAFRNGPFRGLITAQAFSVVGDGIAPIAIAFGILHETKSAAALGIVMACGALPQSLFGLLSAPIGDRLNRVWVMACADFARVTSQTLIGLLFLKMHSGLLPYAVLSAIYGMSSAIFSPTSTVVVASLVEVELLQSANGIRGSLESAGSFIGPAIGGLIVGILGPAAGMFIDALSFAISGAILSFVALNHGIISKFDRENLVADLRKSFRYCVRERWPILGVIHSGLVNVFLLAPFVVLGPSLFFAKGWGARNWGLVIAASGGGGLLGSIYMTRAKIRRPLLAFVIGMAMPGVALISFEAAGPLWTMVLGGLLAGCGMAIAAVSWETTLQSVVPKRHLAGVTGFDYAVGAAFFPLGLAIVGAASTRYGRDAVLLICASYAVVSTAFMWVQPSIRRISYEE